MSGSFPEHSKSLDFDFRDELEMALWLAPVTQLNESGEHSQESMDEVERFGELGTESSDSEITSGDSSFVPGAEVYTDNGHAFPVLCRQAFEVLYPYAGTEAVDDAVREIVEHEMAHVSAAMQIGKTPIFGVRMIKAMKPEGPWRGLMAFVKFKEILTKADLAFIAATPGDLSERDLAIIQSLGYSSAEEAIETHPFFNT